MLYQHKPVGKRIGQCVWFHYLYRHLILTGDEIARVESEIQNEALVGINLIKINLSTRVISLIASQQFDTIDEPALDFTFNMNKGKLTRYRVNPPIFHQKFLMVLPDYNGFNYQESIIRAAQWKDKAPTDEKAFYLKIGRSVYWQEWLSHVGLLSNKYTKN
jgi:hypothetical protein